MKPIWLLFILLLPLNAFAQTAPRNLLLRDVKTIAAPGLTGTVVVYGEASTILVAGRVGKKLFAPVVATGKIGKGRVVGFGHDGYFSDEALNFGDTGRLLANCVGWVNGAKSKPRVGVLNTLGDRTAVVRALAKFGIAALPVEPNGIGNCDVLIGVFSQVAKTDVAALQRFAKAGGGLIGAETGWGWQSIHTGSLLSDSPANQLYKESGVQFAGGTVETTVKNGFDTSVFPENPQSLNASQALRLLNIGNTDPATAAQCVATVTDALSTLPPDDTQFVPQVTALAKGVAPNFSDGKPVTYANALGRLSLTMSVRKASQALPPNVVAHLAATQFPGAVPDDAERKSVTRTVDTARSGWHSTGVYAVAGETIRVTIPVSAVTAGLRIRIGSHTDTLWHLAEWKRAPDISRSFALTQTETVAANAFGGAVFVEVPEAKSAQSVAVTVAGGVTAPLFVRGTTTQAQWQVLRKAKAPWAELVGKHIALSVPSSAVRTLENPEALMAYWDNVLEKCANLYGVPLTDVKPQRYCVDIQISAGYMHSGYPIMTWDDVANRFTDLGVLRGSDGLKSWGFYHELGHNFQQGAWTWEGCGEVTNNLFSLYGCETFNGITPATYGKAHPAMASTERIPRLKKYLDGGAKYADWQADPFLALTLYAQIREAFGWEPFTTVFKAYRTLPESEQPKTDDQRRDQFLIRLSRATKRNLAPFFETWGVPTSKAAQAKVSDLPTWMPNDLPVGK